jgi:hypothetical protein
MLRSGEKASLRKVPAKCLLKLRAIIRFALARRGLATGSGRSENKRVKRCAQAWAAVGRVVTEVSGSIRERRGAEVVAR